MKSLLGAFGVASLSGCSTTMMLPEIAPDEEVEEVYLLRYSGWGHHSLAFVRDEQLVEFCYGDWQLYALSQRDAFTAWKNMTFFTPGTLGRKIVPWKPGESLIENFEGGETGYAFQAPKDKAEALYSRLNSTFESSIEAQVYNEREDVYFVPYDRSYCLCHNCNHEVADWLEELGAKVSGKVFYKPTFIEGVRERPE